jgi:L-fucose isomerase-like protein
MFFSNVMYSNKDYRILKYTYGLQQNISFDRGRGKNMYNDFSVVLGFVPTIRSMFDKETALRNKNDIMKAITGLKDENTKIVDIDWLNEDGFLISDMDVQKVADYFIQQKVDAVFIAHCNFGSEEVVGKLGKALGKPVLLWGPRDDSPPAGFGPRLTDTQCGLFASSKSLLRLGVPFTYTENCRLTDEAFTKGFTDFIRVASVVKAFRTMRIGQISVRPKPFLSTMASEGELLERFGAEIIPINTVMIIKTFEQIKKEKAEEIEALSNDIRSKVMIRDTSEEQIAGIAALELTFKELADRFGLRAIASECWNTFYTLFGVRACFVFGDVTDRWFPVACETDIHGAISSALLAAAARGKNPGFFADLTIRHPENDNAELLWHCGPYPVSLARENTRPEMVDCVGRWEIRGGDITILRFDGCRGEYSLFAGKAKGVEGPSTYGNYVWVEVDDWVRWEKKFIYGPYIHHVAAIHGDYLDVIRESCRYMQGVRPDFA